MTASPDICREMGYSHLHGLTPQKKFINFPHHLQGIMENFASPVGPKKSHWDLTFLGIMQYNAKYNGSYEKWSKENWSL